MAMILLAEDEAVLRMLIGDTLEDEGHLLDIACDGEEALQKISHNQYDLLILDYMMPKLTGFEVLTRMKQMTDKQAAAGARSQGGGHARMTRLRKYVRESITRRSNRLSPIFSAICSRPLPATRRQAILKLCASSRPAA